MVVKSLRTNAQTHKERAIHYASQNIELNKIEKVCGKKNKMKL